MVSVFRDARDVPGGHRALAADVCIIGGGAAGIVLARALGGAGRVVVLRAVTRTPMCVPGAGRGPYGWPALLQAGRGPAAVPRRCDGNHGVGSPGRSPTTTLRRSRGCPTAAGRSACASSAATRRRPSGWSGSPNTAGPPTGGMHGTGLHRCRSTRPGWSPAWFRSSPRVRRAWGSATTKSWPRRERSRSIGTRT